MKNLPADKCPVVGVGDTVRYETRYDDVPSGEERVRTKKAIILSESFTHRCQGTCKAYKCLHLILLDNGDGINPANSLTVDCKLCPVLAKNPSNHEKSVNYKQLCKTVVLHSDPELEAWLNSEISQYSKLGLGQLEIASYDGLKRLKPTRQMSESNLLRGKNNACHAILNWMQQLDLEDLRDEVEFYREFRKSESSFSEGISSVCTYVLERLGAKETP